MDQAYEPIDGVSILPSHFSVPGLGVIPVNAYLIKARAPVLVDTGLHADSDDFLAALRSLIDPRDLRWIWLTHTDQDHVGSLRRLLDEAPRAKVVTSFLGAGKLALVAPLAPERVYLLNPGQSLDVGERTLTAVRPPAYDAPETTGLYDGKSGVFFSSDCFGAVLAAPAQDAADLARETLRERQTLWATIDAPWLHSANEAWLAKALGSVRQMSPSAIFSSHLPPAFGMTEPLLGALSAARSAAPFVGPDQAALEGQRAEIAAA
jgi:flavorubredoxin